MKLENQVVSLELAKQLKELGFPQESLFYWENTIDDNGKVQDESCWKIVYKDNCNFEDKHLIYYSAYTVAELGSVFPQLIEVKEEEENEFTKKWIKDYGKNIYLIINKSRDGWSVNYNAHKYNSLETATFLSQSSNTLADSMAKMLIYLKENKLI